MIVPSAWACAVSMLLFQIGHSAKLRPGECRTNLDCISWAPFCSQYGFCETHDRYGRTLFGLKKINEPESDINKIEADDFYYYYEDYDDRLETTIIERRPKSLLTPVIRPPQRYVAPYLNQQSTHEKTVEKRQNISLLDFDIYPTLRPPPIDFTEFPLHDIFEDSDDYNSIDDQSIAHKINDHHIETTTFSNINTDYKDTIFNDYSENSVESENDISDNSETDNVCPGNNLRQCIEACVPLPKLWVYSVCVRECANRCP